MRYWPDLSERFSLVRQKNNQGQFAFYSSGQDPDDIWQFVGAPLSLSSNDTDIFINRELIDILLFVYSTLVPL